MTRTQTQTHSAFDDLPVLEAQAPNVGTALRRHPIIVLIAVLVCVGLAAAAGLARKATYTATAKLQVGGLNLNSPGALSGLLTADETLAASYARAVNAQPVVATVASQMHISRAEVRAGLSATAIPQSADFTVSGVSKNASTALGLANNAGNALVTYIVDLNRNDADARRIFGRLKLASVQLEQARAQARIAQGAVDRAQGHPTAAETKAMVDANTAVDTASTSVQALRQTYVQALSAQSSTDTAQLVSPAARANSDKATKLEIFMFVGLVAGLLLGAALVTALERRRWARALR